ncbi:MAG: hypothetical protein DRN61_05800, partial [Thaumarchaeota archaeon]
MVKIPIELLRPKIRVRRDLGNLSTLINSIKKRGILQPLIVSEGDDGRYEIVLGHRRYLAALEAGLRELPVIPIGKMSLIEALDLILEEEESKKSLTPDERCLAIAAKAIKMGVRETSRRRELPTSTVESLKKAGITFKGVWRLIRSSNAERSFRAKIKLAEEVYKAVSKAGYKGESSEELMGRLYLMLMDLPTKNAVSLLDKWLENPTLDYMERLVSEAAAGGLADSGTRIRKIEERVPITLDDGKPVEEVLASYSWSAKQRYEIVEENVLKVVEFREGFPGVSGLVCPRCQLPIRCRVCGAL